MTTAFANPPSTSDFSLSDSSTPSEIHAQFDALRNKCPVAYSAENGGFWVLTRYDDIKRCASDTETFISSVKAVIPSDPRGTRRPPLNTDPPTHTPYRTAIDRTLKPARLKRLESVLEGHARREFQVLVDSGSGNVAAEFGANFSAWVEVTWLNLKDETAPYLARTAASWVNAWREQNKEEVKFHSEKLYEIARALFRERRVNMRDPETDPASSLLGERIDGQPIPEEKLIDTLRQCLVVGMVAPPILFGNIISHLASDKPLQSRLRAYPNLIPAAIEEFVRLYVPYRGFCRTASCPVTLHGRTIHPREPITMTYAAANRDPSVFPDPHEFVLGRENVAQHLGFGRGRHRCAGMPLARMALQIGVRMILEMTSDFEVMGELEFAKMPEMGISTPQKPPETDPSHHSSRITQTGIPIPPLTTLGREKDAVPAIGNNDSTGPGSDAVRWDVEACSARASVVGHVGSGAPGTVEEPDVFVAVFGGLGGLAGNVGGRGCGGEESGGGKGRDDGQDGSGFHRDDGGDPWFDCLLMAEDGRPQQGSRGEILGRARYTPAMGDRDSRAVTALTLEEPAVNCTAKFRIS
ncbi:cytochrome P450 [Clohesyomyces aquaticus]|uniref:Cytochrome P450 n=1 Tax=Clohesyomyces aquaticus TaxID=1231657 RepID=A0A1Y2A3B4_9PLEO|nr:cytochrome P450 [Clohesyomyces aquaticus]